MKYFPIICLLFDLLCGFRGPGTPPGARHDDPWGRTIYNRPFYGSKPRAYFAGPSDSTTFITYDTTIVYNFDPFHSFRYHLRITRPLNLFLANSPDTAARQFFWSMPGVGEMGTDTTKLYTYGPHYWLKNGWDGGVQLGNGRHYPILVTAICEVTQPPVAGSIWIINYFINHYHIKPKGVHVFGLSEGAFTNGAMLGITDTTGTSMTGADVGMRNITSATFLSGVASANPGPTPAQYSEFGHWAKKYGGHAFLTVGYSDAQAPYPPLAAAQMQDSVPGSVYFAYNTVAGGGHGGWNTEYDPNLLLWNSGTTGFTPAGTYVTTNTYPNMQGAYRSPSSLFQNALRMGDTSLAGGGTTPSGPIYTKEAFAGEYWFGLHAQNDTLYALQAGGFSWTAIPLPSGQLLKTGAIGFNNFRLISTTGNYYRSTDYNISPVTLTQTPLDTAGAAFSNCLAVWTYCDGTVVLRSDSSLALVDNDTLGIIHPIGTRYIITKPIQISQAGVKYRHVSMGPNGIYGTTTDGKIYLWPYNTQPRNVPTMVWGGSPVRAMMTSTANQSAVVALMRNTTGDTTCGQIYALGNSWGDWGGTGATYSVFTNISSILQWPRSIRFIQMNSNAFHWIDSLGFTGGVAKCNSQGELGNGQEFVNRYTYSTYPGLGYTFTQSENPVPGPGVLVGGTTKFASIAGNAFFGFYKIWVDSSGGVWFDGRNKTISADGDQMNSADNQAHPNALDRTKLTQIFPYTQGLTILNFTTPTASAGSNQTIGTTSTTLTASGIPVTLTLQSNNLDTLKQRIISWLWVQTQGVSSTITCPTCAVTTVTGLATGAYRYRVLETDDNGGQDTAGVNLTVNVSSPTPPTVSAGSNQTITLPTNSVTLAGTAGANAPATSIVSYGWSQISGPSTGVFSSTTTPAPTFSSLIAGPYVLQLLVTDNLGGTNTSTVTITVNPVIPPPPSQTLQLRVKFRLTQP